MKKPIATVIVPYKKFWEAEEYHQYYRELANVASRQTNGRQWTRTRTATTVPPTFCTGR